MPGAHNTPSAHLVLQDIGLSGPDYATADGTYEAYDRRLQALESLLINKGGFQKAEVSAAFINSDPATKEPIARWLRHELRKLREGEVTRGAAPALTGKTIPRALIADLTFTMIECASYPGDELLSLLQELLNVDRHRKDLAAESRRKFELAATFEAQAALQGRRYGVQDIRRIVKVSSSTASAWKKSSEYRTRVKQEEKFWAHALEPHVKKLRTKDPTLTQERGFQVAIGSEEIMNEIVERRAKWDPDGADKLSAKWMSKWQLAPSQPPKHARRK